MSTRSEVVLQASAWIRRTVTDVPPGHSGPGFYWTGDQVGLVVDVLTLPLAASLPGPVGALAVDALLSAEGWLLSGDPILARLLARRDANADSGDSREVSLLQEHLKALCGAQGLLRRWAGSLRQALAPVAPRRLQLDNSPGTVVLSARRLRSHGARSRCKAPCLPDAPSALSTPAVDEARWLLACSSWRDGARRDKSLVVVHIPAYLLVARLLGRLPVCLEARELPALAAPKDEWFAAANRWASELRLTHSAWISRDDPHLRAAEMGWPVPRDVPMLTLRASALETLLSGRGVTLPRVAEQTPSLQGHAAHVEVPYGDRSLIVARRRVRNTKQYRLYYELPFTAPPNQLRPEHHTLTVKGKVLWSQKCLQVMAEEGVGGAADFLAHARQVEDHLPPEQFHREKARRAYVAAVAGVQAGAASRLGPLTVFEREAVASVLEGRAPGPFTDEDWAELAAAMPGRRGAAVRRIVARVLLDRSRELGWRAFRASGYWPGGSLSRRLYAASRKP